MANEERKELLDKANELGLDFPNNIPTEKLKAMVEESSSPAVKPDEGEEEQTPEVKTVATNSTVPKTHRQRVMERKKQAFKTRVVTITNKDNRENDVTTTAPLSFENQYFSLAKNVPLDVAVELEQCLIDIAKSTMITMHKDEVVEGKRTGNKIPVQVKKYVISYAE